MKDAKKELIWFTNRIGTTIFRDVAGIMIEIDVRNKTVAQRCFDFENRSVFEYYD